MAEGFDTYGEAIVGLVKSLDSDNRRLAVGMLNDYLARAIALQSEAQSTLALAEEVGTTAVASLDPMALIAAAGAHVAEVAASAYGEVARTIGAIIAEVGTDDDDRPLLN